MKTLVGLMMLGGLLTVAPPAVAQDDVVVRVEDRNLDGRQVERWRYRRHNGRWWYWTPNRTWVYWEGNQWVPYGSRQFVYRTPGYYRPGGSYYYGPGGYYDGYYNYSPRRAYRYGGPAWRYGYRDGYRYGYGPGYRYGYRGYGPGVYIGRGGVGIRF
jgi:hypothetical protein